MITAADPSPEALDRIAFHATLAPSPHNAQGWLLAWDGSAFELRQDCARTVLPEIDPRQLEGLIGLGAAVENLELSARREGFEPRTEWEPRPAEPDLVARVTLAHGAGPGTEQRLVRQIERRAVCRGPYRLEPIPDGILDDLRTAASAEGLDLHVATDRVRIERLAELVAAASTLKFSHEATHRELFRWLRFSAGDIARSRDGLPLDLFGVPAPLVPAARVVMRWECARILAPLGFARALACTNDAMLLRRAPAVCLLSGGDGSRRAYLRGGRAFQRIGLLAAERGLAIHPHSALSELGFARRAGYHESIPASWRREIDGHPAALRDVFDHGDDAHVIAIFRLGVPVKLPARLSPRRPVDEVFERTAKTPPPNVAGLGHDGFHARLVERNAPVLDAEDQQRLRRARVCVAGCGSIGGAVVEPLVRMGAERLLLAEPGRYDLDNLNRQSAVLSDVGRNKAEVLRERATAINPHAAVLVAPEGVTAENVAWLVASSAAVVDGVDVTDAEALRAKRLLHEEAYRRRVPVVSGYDIGGTQLVRVYDYRRTDLRPLDGRLDGVSAVGSVEFLSRVLAPLDFPIEILGVVEARIRGSQAPLPQLAPTAALFGVIATWALVDLIAGRPVREKIRVDAPQLVRPVRRMFGTGVLRLVELARLKLLFERTRRS